MDNAITPERLRMLAKAMGKEQATIRDDEVRLYEQWSKILDSYIYIGFNPDKDWSQCGEVLEWMLTKNLHDDDCDIFIGCYGVELIFRSREAITFGPDNRKESIVLAALAYVESKDEI